MCADCHVGSPWHNKKWSDLLRVLMLVSEAPPIKSGISRVAGELVDRLRAMGVTVDVLSANEIPRWSFKEFRLSALALRWRIVQRRIASYDIIHVHGMVPTFSDVGLIFGRLGRRLAHSEAAIVYTHHSYIDIAGLDLPVGLYNRLHSRLLGLADHVVASTPTYASRLEGSSRESRVSAVRFGVDADQFPAPTAKPERFNVLFVGQLRPYKGVDTLLKAWRYMGNADLHIVGDGHERANLEEICTQLRLKSVYFHGSATEKQLRQFYEDAHVLVLPSNRIAEAFGLVLLEGMSAGCVPVSSDLPGVADVVGRSGYTFPVGNSHALAAVLTELQNNPRQREQMSVLAVARSVATDWDYTAEAYYGIYQQAYLGRQLELALKHGKGKKPKVVQGWLEKVTSAAEADRASLMLVTHGRRRLVIAASVGLPVEVAANTALQIGHRMAGFVSHTGRPLLIRRKQMVGIARLFVKRDSKITSSLILPLEFRGKQIGVLNLARGDGRLAFTEADKHWLHNLSRQVAPLLEGYMREQRISGISIPTASRQDGHSSVERPVPLDKATSHQDGVENLRAGVIGPELVPVSDIWTVDSSDGLF